MDPRNFLDENHIYMFEQLAYDSSSQTQAGVEAILQGSFMYKNNIGYIDTAGKYQTTNTLYSAQIMTAAKTAKVSAYHIASKILQEIGSKANSKYAGMVPAEVLQVHIQRHIQEFIIFIILELHQVLIQLPTV